MEKLIKLKNEYYLKIIEDNSIDKILGIQNISIKDITLKKEILIKIDFNLIKEKDYKKIIKRISLIKKLKKLENNKNIFGYILNYTEANIKQKDFIDSINAILCSNRKERYNYIYDIVCENLDKHFYGDNTCDFINNKCGEKRNTNSTIGCCRHFKTKWLGFFSTLVKCEYLNENTKMCDANCISCKLYTCNYLEKKGVKFKIKDILLLDVFFNPLQKYFIKYMVFTPKEKIIKRLLIT